jgi:hypothetical protein
MTSTPLRLLATALALLVPFAASAQEVRGRELHQQQRIGQGLASGQITARGAGEYRNLNRRENAASAQVYTDKHNDIAQPGVTPR